MKTQMPNELIIFYSRADENYSSGILKNLEVGNTEVAAEIIKNLTGAETFKIEQDSPYSKDYNKCIAEAQADQRANARSELKTYPENVDDYVDDYNVIYWLILTVRIIINNICNPSDIQLIFLSFRITYHNFDISC